ncbi:MAG TPA: alpha/beta fold hydrolase [Thermoanaerobaculia bacterium]|nr:alpha/beta fold hydrolase [Thermoanaerobaculia bacterium]
MLRDAVRLAGLLLLTPASGLAAPLAPCPAGAWPEGAECRHVRVPEDRTIQGGRMLDLFLVRLRSTGPESAQGAVFFLAGGPGEAASESAADLPGALAVLRSRRDLVFVDQRGTGRSHALTCPGPFRSRVEFGELSADDVRACREVLERRADLRRYTTWDAVADLETVRQALGYEKIDLFAASYGTQVAQAYLRRHEERVRTAVFVGALPLAPELVLFDSRDAERALRLLLQDCAAEPACAAAFPRLSEETAEVLKRLEQSPVRVKVADPAGGDPREILLDRQTFARVLRTRLYSAGAAARVPLSLHRAFTGDYASMGRAAVAIAHAQKRHESLGMFLTVICSELMGFVGEASIRRMAEGTLFGPETTLGWLQNCREWPRADPPPDFAAPVRSDVPVLLLSGRLDPVTPPHWGEQVAVFLPRARQIVFAASSHFPEGDCASGLVAQFVEQASTARLNARCAESEVRPPFLLPEG